MIRKPVSLVLFLWVIFGAMPAVQAAAPEKVSAEAAAVLERVPVQQGGRVKPFGSFASEAVLYVTGRSHFRGHASVDLVWQWMTLPEKWAGQPLIPVTHPQLREELGLMLVKNRIAPEVVLQHEPFLEKVREASEHQQRKDILSQTEKKRLEIYEKALFFQGMAEGGVPGFVAHPEDPRAGWLPLSSILSQEGTEVLTQFFPPAEAQRLSASLSEAFKSMRGEEGLSGFTRQRALAVSESLDQLFRSRQIILDRALLNKELLYMRARPFSKAWEFYFLSFLLGLAASAAGFGRPEAGRAARGLNLTSLAAYGTAFAIHAWGFVLRCTIAGRPPVTNMYESMIWVSWGVAFFALVLFFFYRTLFVRNTAALVAGVALLLAQAFPVALNPAISPLVPVLRSNLWLTVHVLTITLSYAAFLLAWGLGHGVIYSFAFAREDLDRQRRLSQYLYRTIQIGVVLLAAGTILGGVWANYSWGRFWGWDPKETWALIALLGYLVVLHSRFTGWTGNFGIAVGSCVAFLGVLMAWYGVNFVLGAGLHSYGFGGGGLPYVLMIVAADLALIGAMAWRYKSGAPKQKLAGSRS